jgi:predicted acyl esterase
MKRSLSLLVVLTLALNACESNTGTSDQGEVADVSVDQVADDAEMSADLSTDAQVSPEPDQSTGPNTSEASFKVRGTLGMIYVWDAPVEDDLEVLNSEGDVIATARTDDLGSIVIRELEPDSELSVRVKSAPDNVVTQIKVLAQEDLPPDESLYTSQTLQPGNQYITMRDGTQLHIFVSLPGPIEDGPYPTVVNYSGYSPGRPGRKLSDTIEPFCVDFPVLCNVPGYGAGIFVGIMGYASVGINMRGTGCSGGAYDFFEPLQLMDGYDVIEIIARQEWVKHNKVGMVGLSYPGIAQLFVAKTRPPSLAAITPMSVLADSASSTLAPGGIFNDGFALDWIENVLNRAKPYGHGWIQDVIDNGDELCAEHQKLHGQLVDVVSKALANPFYTEDVAAPVDPSSWVDVIDVPVYLTGQWQDEQTGPHFAALLDKFTGSPHARFTVGNGIHVDGFTPQILMEWKTFLDFFVAREVPSLDDQLRSLVPLFYSQLYGVSLELPPNRFAEYDDFETALAAYNAEPKLRVIWESGGVPGKEGSPVGTFETFHSGWPIPDTLPTRWYLHPDGALKLTSPSSEGGASSYLHDPDAANRTILPSGDISSIDPPWEFPLPEPDHAAIYMSEELTEDVVMLGHASVDLWFASTATDADIEVMLTEVRPDGQEMLVQNGWLRASHRKLRDDSTELRPIKTHLREDNQPLEDGFNEVRVELMPFGHIFRAGSKIRLTIDTPGDSMARWFFLLLDQPEGTQHIIAHDMVYPSSVLFPVIPSVDVEPPMPSCTLRGQPCREFAPYQNTIYSSE